MQLALLSPRKSLNKAFLKVKPSRNEIELFKSNLVKLLGGLDESESEEHVKNDLSDFLKNTFYQQFYINTKGRNDLVIHNGPDAKSAAGVLVEAKKPSNKFEMIHRDDLNTKAFHELILYYLRERITNHNLEIKHLVATNIYGWYVFDANIFEKLFAQNKGLVKQFTDFEEGRLAGKTTDFFYKQIAEPFMAGLTSEICFTWFDFREYDKPLRNDDKQDDSKLIALYKLLSPEHLLKLPFSNDSNSLDKGFYTELLHIIGLAETKDGSKKLIGRKKEGQRDPGSLLENVIVQIDSLDMIGRLEKPSRFGDTNEERLFNVSLELVITWINRILFLKLLEAQLIKYHRGDAEYAFLTIDKVKGYDSMNSLFFRVLAKKIPERDPAVAKLFEKVPYLNSSLFEPTDLERETLFISNLQDDCLIPIHSATVLKNTTGKKLTGSLNGLDYLFAFLEAYDFSSEGAEEIQEENKTLINASVLGLIFEKINGYKDGSFFTPGFITMYMCRETIRRAVVQKFNDLKGWNCQGLEELYNKIEDLKDANLIINQLKICDPAVGSGHFLVSALNEIIAVKSELKILSDKEGKRLKEYHVEVVNDELIVTDEDGELFEYNPKNPESQRVQEALFHEKQTIIENCLFGVDINPNSVKICRLRLWIELLKNAYYSPISPFHNFTISPSHNSPISPSHNSPISPSQNFPISPFHNFAISPFHNSPISPFPLELETLPNIDINIKCGNSLISRYALDADIKQALKKSKWSIDSYRMAVMMYRNATSKEQKREMEKLISTIKNEFQVEIGQNDPKKKKLAKLLNELYHRFTGAFLFEPEAGYGNDKINEKAKKEQDKLEDEIAKLKQEIDDIKTNKIFENAFEWRFEFPEVLNDEGDFVGFDVVIGNPPYVILTRNKIDPSVFMYFNEHFTSIANSSSKNIFVLFIEKSIQLLKIGAINTFIVPEGLFKTRSYHDCATLLDQTGSVFNITEIRGMVFDEANTGNLIYCYVKNSKVPLNSYFFDTDQKLKTLLVNKDPILAKLEDKRFAPLGEIAILFKGMVVADRNNVLFEQANEDTPDSFLLGNCISKWMVKKSYYTDYKLLKIIGGTKLKSKHDIFPRILIRRTGDSLCCAFLEKPALTESTLYSCWSNSSELENKFLLALFHSRLMNYFIKNKLVTNEQAFPQILMTDLESLPIVKIGLIEQQPFISLVDIILEAKYSDANSVITEMEADINKLVYQLYGLTEEEIKIVENP